MRLKLASSIALSLFAACSTPRLDVTPRWGTVDISVDVGIASGGVVAQADLETAGLQADDSVFGGRLDFDWGGLHLMASAQDSTHDGEGTLTATISSGGVTIPVGAAVASELDLGLYNALLTFDFIPTELVEFGLGGGVTYIDLDASFEEDATGATVATDEAAPIPVLAARVSSRFWRIDASVEASGMAISYDGTAVTLLDIDAMAKLRLFGGDNHLAAHLAAGYRWTDLDVEYEDGSDEVDGNVTLEGPWVGLTISI